MTITGYRWSQQDQNFLRERFQTMTILELAQALNRTKKGVVGKAHCLQLHKRRYPAPREAVCCGNCGKVFYDYPYRKRRHCSWNCYLAKKGWTKRKELEYRRRSDKLRMEKWLNGVPKETCRRGLRHKRAESIAPIMLQTIGFHDVQRFWGSFAFDFLAKRNDKVFAIEVTTAISHEFSDTERSFLQYTDWQFAILFISPDFTRYWYKEGVPSRNRICVHINELIRIEPSLLAMVFD